ncbi:ubiquinol-cytochrome c reductase complex assembly factor 5-like [Calliopsis andreniformis]|uniref:ubiquinol-cytochrome c reductase complex assembly factor 5-like n=1 Tax=Calliopsis andreniformis TaxID=337506 RepID=UPI003FCC3D4E
MANTLFYRIRRQVRIFHHNMPLKFLGEFRLLPIFFIAGAALEFTMIHWHVGEVNFYKTYKKRQIEKAVEERLRAMEKQST